MLKRFWQRMLSYVGEFFRPTNVIQVAIALLIFYYCFETHKLRQSSEAQLEAVNDQLNYQYSPILEIVFRPRPTEERGKENPAARHGIRSEDGTRDYVPFLITHNEQPALGVCAIQFDKQSESYLWSGGFLSVIPGKKEQPLPLATIPISADALHDALNRQYRICGPCVDDWLKGTNASFLAVCYSNSLGQGHYLKQPYYFKDGALVPYVHESGQLESETYDIYNAGP
ncbi:MAG TPA: hypothetical protein VEX43_16500 [Chthoniobacterales bacterium]|nr:hypothetical protein [Chthoniobacterales bacterium]